LNTHNLYYTKTPTELDVLGAIAIRNVEGAAEVTHSGYCFSVTNTENDEWIICTEDEESH